MVFRHAEVNANSIGSDAPTAYVHDLYHVLVHVRRRYNSTLRLDSSVAFDAVALWYDFQTELVRT